MKGKAQQEPFLSSYDALMALKSSRLQKNAHLKTTGVKDTWDQILNLKPEQIDAFNAEFTSDSINWQFVIAGQSIVVTFPNDISLVLGADRSELQEHLLERFCETVNKHPVISQKPDWLCDTLWVKTNSRYAFTRFALRYIVGKDKLALCIFEWVGSNQSGRFFAGLLLKLSNGLSGFGN